VAKAMKAHARQTGLSTEFRKPVTHSAGRETALVIDVSGEDPLTELRHRVHAPPPCRFAAPPKFSCGPPENQPAHLFRLGRSDLFTGRTPLDRQYSSVEVAESERSELAPPSA
jgi:hypothetical protein